MRVTIWDLDYYYAKERRNCFNVDAMKISSYHKQKGDTINFVSREYDIRRPYDIYYIIKEKSSTPNPPFDFYTNSKVIWLGNANKARCNWHPDRVLLACRPDYLLYPEKNTREERAEYIRLFDNRAQLLPITQDYSNSFKNKSIFVADRYMWASDKKSILQALKLLQDVKNLSFLEPIRLQKIVDDKDIREEFLALKITARSKITFTPIPYEYVDKAIVFYQELRQKFPRASLSKLTLSFDAAAHWTNYVQACQDFAHMRQAVIKTRQAGVPLVVQSLSKRLNTPYFHLFEELNKWTSRSMAVSWCTYLLSTHPKCNLSIPATWDDAFRDLVRQTYWDRQFFLIVWKDRQDSVNDVPWETLDKEFKYGL